MSLGDIAGELSGLDERVSGKSVWWGYGVRHRGGRGRDAIYDPERRTGVRNCRSADDRLLTGLRRLEVDGSSLDVRSTSNGEKVMLDAMIECALVARRQRCSTLSFLAV